MPNFSKPSTGGKKPYKSAAPKAGSRSEGHRGFRADAPVAKKRWTTDDRAARTGDRQPSSDRRPNWTPEKPARAERSERPAYGDRAARTERPAYGDRAQRSERPAYGDRPARSYDDRPARTERPAYGDRAPRTERPAYNNDRPQRSYDDRPARNERPAYGDRPARTERPAYGNDRPQRSYSDRPARSYDDRPARTERPAYGDRPARTERPAYNDRPARSYDDRPARTERPAYGERPARTERPAYGTDRPQRSYSDRPARSYDDRPQRSYSDRPARSYEDRAPKRESDFYTARSTNGPVDDVVLERLEAKVITAGDAEGVTWGDLGIGDNMTRQLVAMGAESPFPIQAATIPDVLSGQDVLGRGKTGSGKTIAFGAPLVERLMENNGGRDRQVGRKPRALILAPTRELAQQIDRTVHRDPGPRRGPRRAGPPRPQRRLRDGAG
jgi:hypothetical protein